MRVLSRHVKKAIWLLPFSLLMTPLLIQFFEAGSFRASASDSSYKLMINDVDTYFVPDTPDINISTVEIDDDETYVYFRLNVTGSVNTTHWYGIDLCYDQDGKGDHTVQLYDGEFEWDWSIQLINSSFSGSSIVWIVPKWLETDSNFAIEAFAYNRLTWSSDYAPGGVGEWSSPYVWQVGNARAHTSAPTYLWIYIVLTGAFVAATIAVFFAVRRSKKKQSELIASDKRKREYG